LSSPIHPVKVSDTDTCNVLYYTFPMAMFTSRRAVFGPPPLPLIIVEDLIQAAVVAARDAREAPTPAARRPRRHSLTLRPGVDTPLWNELVRQVRPYLRRHGSKAQLARLLGLPRQRLQDCLKAKSACLDAERTLLLLGWLGFFQRGGELAPVVRPGRSPSSGKALRVPDNL